MEIHKWKQEVYTIFCSLISYKIIDYREKEELENKSIYNSSKIINCHNLTLIYKPISLGTTLHYIVVNNILKCTEKAFNILLYVAQFCWLTLFYIQCKELKSTFFSEGSTGNKLSKLKWRSRV